MFLCTAVAFGQSSGNFSASYFSAACAINDGNTANSPGGITFTGGVCTNNASNGSCKVLDSAITTSSGNGVTLLITPSAVTGLYTDTNVSNTITTATAEIGIQVCVQVDGSGANVVGGDTNGCAIFDERLQQVNQNFLAAVASLATCDTSTGTNTCSLELILATLSAHSYNFIAQVPNGTHDVSASWSIVNANTSSSGGTVGACLGPGNVTITQTKVFKNSGAIVPEN